MLTEKRPRTLFVGLDAACWPYVTPLLEAGRLPALQRLVDEGTSGTLLSTMPALTPTAWASTIVLGWHYFIDGVIGVGVSFACVWVVRKQREVLLPAAVMSRIPMDPQWPPK